ncbi:hypothetical protein [Desulfolithobacter sp.]
MTIEHSQKGLQVFSLYRMTGKDLGFDLRVYCTIIRSRGGVKNVTSWMGKKPSCYLYHPGFGAAEPEIGTEGKA